MTDTQLALRVTTRMAAWGALGGAASGIVYGFLVMALAGSRLSLLGAAFGFAFGGGLGLALGVLNGLVLSLLINYKTSQTLNTNQYKTTLGMASVLLTFVGAVLGFGEFTTSLNVTGLGWIVYTVIPTLIAMALAWKATTRAVLGLD